MTPEGFRSKRPADEMLDAHASRVEVLDHPERADRLFVCRTLRNGRQRLHFVVTVTAGTLAVSVTRATPHGQASLYSTMLELSPEDADRVAALLASR